MGNHFSDQKRMGDLHGWHVYVVAEEGDAFSKIGTALTVDYRLESLRSGNPRRLMLARSWHFDSRSGALSVEKLALSLCSDRIQGRDWVAAPCATAIAAVERSIEMLQLKMRAA